MITTLVVMVSYHIQQQLLKLRLVLDSMLEQIISIDLLLKSSMQNILATSL